MKAEVLPSGELSLKPDPNTRESAKTRAQLAQEIAEMHKDWPVGQSVVRWMRDQGY